MRVEFRAYHATDRAVKRWGQTVLNEPLREVAARFGLGEAGVWRETSTFSDKDEFRREMRPCDQGMIIYVKRNSPFSGHDINDRNGFGV